MMIAQTIPETLEAAIDSLYASLAEDDKTYMRTPESTPGKEHMWAGRNLRNAWNLWGARPEVSTVLCDHFKARFGLGCADDMSGMILAGLWARVRGEAYDPDADAAHYHEFWRKQGRNALTLNQDGPPPPPADRGFLRAPVPPRGRYRRTWIECVADFFVWLFRFDASADPGGIR